VGGSSAHMRGSARFGLVAILSTCRVHEYPQRSPTFGYSLRQFQQTGHAVLACAATEQFDQIASDLHDVLNRFRLQFGVDPRNDLFDFASWACGWTVPVSRHDL
jgi:hypothetical protein